MDDISSVPVLVFKILPEGLQNQLPYCVSGIKIFIVPEFSQMSILCRLKIILRTLCGKKGVNRPEKGIDRNLQFPFAG